MKRRLNILCLIVLVLMGWSVLETGYYMLRGAATGFKAGWEYAKQQKENPQAAKTPEMETIGQLQYMEHVHLSPKTFDMEHWLADSVYNARTQQYVPAMYAELMVSVPRTESTAMQIANTLLGLLKLAVSIWAIVLFIKWVVAVNRSDIFTWHNVRRLRRMGVLMLVSCAATWLVEYLTVHSVEQVFTLPGYELSLAGTVPLSVLLLGLCSLIVAEVFAIGLRMKEEQDLTI